MTEGPELIPETVTCHTEGCDNAGIPIDILAAEHVVCGVCSQPITDRITH